MSDTNTHPDDRLREELEQVKRERDGAWVAYTVTQTDVNGLRQERDDLMERLRGADAREAGLMEDLEAARAEVEELRGIADGHMTTMFDLRRRLSEAEADLKSSTEREALSRDRADSVERTGNALAERAAEAEARNELLAESLSYRIVRHDEAEAREARLRVALDDLLARISITQLDMGGNHRYHIRNGSETVLAMSNARAALAKKEETNG